MSNETTTMNAQTVEDLAKKIIGLLIGFPRDLVICHNETDQTVALAVQSHADDVGKIYGFQRANHGALQSILTMCSLKIGKRTKLLIEEPTVGQRYPKREFILREDWPAKEITDLLNETCAAVFALPFNIETNSAGNSTAFEIQIDRGERLPVKREDLALALATIFHAIGKAQGRQIFVDIV